MPVFLSWMQEKELANYFEKWPKKPEEIQEFVMSWKPRTERKVFQGGGYGQFCRMSLRGQNIIIEMSTGFAKMEVFW